MYSDVKLFNLLRVTVAYWLFLKDTIHDAATDVVLDMRLGARDETSTRFLSNISNGQREAYRASLP